MNQQQVITNNQKQIVQSENKTYKQIDYSNLRSFIINEIEVNSQKFCQNYIKTTKYNIYSFLPLSILNQYKRVANIYFLAISIICLIPEISPWAPFTQILPTLFVLGIAVIREAIEDYYRYLQDLKSNQQPVFKVLKDGSLQNQMSNQIYVGDLIWVPNESEIPADILLIGGGNIQSKDGQIECFVKTSQLDGEKNLKKKASPKFLKIEDELFYQQKQKYSQKIFPVIEGQIVCEHPNKDLTQFNGILRLFKKHQFESDDMQDQIIDCPKEYTLQENNLLLKGTKLMNTTDGILGIVVYSGQDTKLLQNQNKSRYKQSKVELETNKIVIGMLFFTIIASLVLAWLSYRQNMTTGDQNYYLFNQITDGLPSKNGISQFIITSLSNICLNSTFIPISLIVAIEITKIIQSYFIIQDIELIQVEYEQISQDFNLSQNQQKFNNSPDNVYDANNLNFDKIQNNEFNQTIEENIIKQKPISMQGCKVQTSSLNEELGQVRYIFSDKTGTLTRNIMEFRMCKIGSQIYADESNLLLQFDDINFNSKQIGQEKNKDENSIIKSHRSQDEWEKGSQRSKISNVSNQSKRSNINQKQGASYNYQNQNLEDIIFKLDEHQTKECEIQIISENQKVALNFKNQKRFVDEFMKCLSINHECMTNIEKKGDKDEVITYQGTSPDEVALLEFTEKHGYQFELSTDEEIKVFKKTNQYRSTNDLSVDISNFNIVQDDPNTNHLRFQLIKKFEFNSDRKRMSIVVKDMQDGFYKIYTKGADNVIKERLKNIYFRQINTMNKNLSYEYNFDQNFLNDNKIFKDTQNSIKQCRKILDETNNFLFQASTQGYRTLLVCMKILDQDEVNQLIEECDQAEKDLNQRNQCLQEVYERWEQNLYLLGATVVEDRLQDQVPQTIKALHQADIKLWVLTGDKLETAESIGFSSQLLNLEMDIMRCRDDYDAKTLFNKEQSKINQNLIVCGKKRAIIIEQFALKFILSKENQNIKRWFLKIARSMETVICCRVSPSQKAEVVRLIKMDDPDIITLAIGDGANDVPMILEADIGVGIFGKEGMRAADSSDFAISEFRHLWTLLFKWGRWNYFRQCMNINYYLYKNFIYTLFQILFQLSNLYSSQTIFPDMFLTLFNMMLTTFPVFCYAINEVDLYPSSFEMNEDLNTIEQQNTILKDSEMKQSQFNPLLHLEAYDPSFVRIFIPYLYYQGQRNLLFNQWVYLWWILRGLFECLVIYVLIFLVFTDGHTLNNQGESGDLWTFGMTIFTSLFFVVTNKLMIKIQKFDFLMFFATLFLSFILYYLILYVTDSWYITMQQCFTLQVLYQMPLFYIIVFFVVGFCFIIDLLFESFSKLIMTDTKDYLRQSLLNTKYVFTDEFLIEFQRLVDLQQNISMIEDELKEQEIDQLRSMNTVIESQQGQIQNNQVSNFVKTNTNSASLNIVNLKMIRTFQNLLFRYTNLTPYNIYGSSANRSQSNGFQKDHINLKFFNKSDKKLLINNDQETTNHNQNSFKSKQIQRTPKIINNKIQSSPIFLKEETLDQYQKTQNQNFSNKRISNLIIIPSFKDKKSQGTVAPQEQFLMMRDSIQENQIIQKNEINSLTIAQSQANEFRDEFNSINNQTMIPRTHHTKVEHKFRNDQQVTIYNQQEGLNIQIGDEQINGHHKNTRSEVDQLMNDLGLNQNNSDKQNGQNI